MSRYKHPKVVFCKLGKEQADGIMSYEEGVMYIDERLRGKRKLETILHEYTHHLHPDWTEEQVTGIAAKTIDFLWKHGTRIVDNKKE